MPTGPCHRCNQTILWLTNEVGDPWPLDPEPHPEGDYVILMGSGGAGMALHRPDWIERERHRSHWDTCPKWAGRDQQPAGS